MNWLSQLLAPITEIIKIPLEGSEKRKVIAVEEEAKATARVHELNLKKLEISSILATQGVQIESDWDTNAQNDAKTSWKDEYLTIIFSVPLILAFIPYTQGAVLQGFATLDKTPDWYLVLVGGIVSAVFGLRWLVSKKGIR